MSSKHRHSSGSDTKGTQFLRNFMAFLLFVSISVLSVSVCAKVVVLNPDEFAKRFTDKEFVNSLYLDVKQYSYDLCDECSIPYDSVDNVVTFSSVYEIADAYYYGNLTNSEHYSPTTYLDRIDELSSSLSKDTKAQLKEYNIEINDAQKAKGIKSFSERIADYIKKSVEFKYMEKLQTVSNLSGAGLIAVIIVSVIMALIFSVIVLFIGNKKYRGVRAIAYSFIASGWLDFVMVLGVAIVRMTKQLVVYPTYLCDAIMRYVEDSTNVFIGAGLASFVVAIILMTVVWKLKRNEK